MGTYSKGILGGFSGTIGTVIGSSWKGIEYMRSQPVKSSKKAASPAQDDQRAKFGMMGSFIEVLTAYLGITFSNYAVRMTANNAAMSWNLDNAIMGKSPDFMIDYSKALVSRGKLLNANSPAVSVSNGVAYFTWSDNSGDANALATDVAMPLLYCPALKLCSYTAKVQRSDTAASVNVSLFEKQVVETWLAFVSADGTETSMSVFLGELSV